MPSSIFSPTGTELDPESIEDEFDQDSSEEDFDQGRQLCPDDACVGVLDAEGICKECGATSGSIPVEATTSEASAVPRADVDLLHRKLCPDGGCIGLLGPDGRCKDCGRVGDDVLSDPRLRGLKPDPDEAKADEDEEEEPSSDAEFGLSDGDSATFENRQLCPDGGCIGVIGSKGTCNECGSVA